MDRKPGPQHHRIPSPEYPIGERHNQVVLDQAGPNWTWAFFHPGRFCHGKACVGVLGIFPVQAGRDVLAPPPSHCNCSFRALSRSTCGLPRQVEEQEDNILQAASDRRILSRHGAVVLKLHPWLCLVLKPGLQVRLPLEGPGTRGTDSSLRLSDAAPPLRAAHRRSLTGRDVVLVFEIELQGCPPQSRVFSMRSRLLMRLRRSKLERRKGHANFVIRPDLVHGIVD